LADRALEILAPVNETERAYHRRSDALEKHRQLMQAWADF